MNETLKTLMVGAGLLAVILVLGLALPFWPFILSLTALAALMAGWLKYREFLRKHSYAGRVLREHAAEMEMLEANLERRLHTSQPPSSNYLPLSKSSATSRGTAGLRSESPAASRGSIRER